MSATQRLEIEEIGDVTVVRFLDPRVSHPMEIDELGRQLYQVLERKDRSKLVIDFSPVEFISSAMIGKLISLNRKAKAGTSALRLCNLRQETPRHLPSLQPRAGVRHSRGPGRGHRLVLSNDAVVLECEGLPSLFKKRGTVQTSITLFRPNSARDGLPSRSAHTTNWTLPKTRGGL